MTPGCRTLASPATRGGFIGATTPIWPPEVGTTLRGRPVVQSQAALRRACRAGTAKQTDHPRGVVGYGIECHRYIVSPQRSTTARGPRQEVKLYFDYKCDGARSPLSTAMAFINPLGFLMREQTTYLVAGALVVSFVALAVQRLWLSPLARFPGPKLAALTQLYEFYYDVILGGQYTFKIIELHEKYGPVVRINPWEVHVKISDSHSELYSGFVRPRESWNFCTKQFGGPRMSFRLSSAASHSQVLGNALTTINHDHKPRPPALDTFFSVQNVRKLQLLIEERADALLHSFAKHAAFGGGRPLNVMYPFSAYTNVEESDYGADVTDSMLMGTHLGHLIKHAGWTLTVVDNLPDYVSSRWVPGWSGLRKMNKDILAQVMEIKATTNTEKWAFDVSHPTIFHELLSTETLSPEEKTPARLAHEGQILIQSGTLTVSWTLSLATFHLLNRPSTLRTLRDELFAAILDPDEVVPLAQLEELPYLRAVVKESLRLAIGTSSRLDRIPADETLICRDPESGQAWKFKPGTVVSMSPYITAMDETIFPDPKAFRPERWLEEGAEGLERHLVIFGGSRTYQGDPLAYAELHLMLAKLFRRWGSANVTGGNDLGDCRPGDVGVLRIFETTVKDCEMASDYFIPMPQKGSKGLRFVLETC
ncbi:Cytochrome P450 monooxygenase sdnE [Paramyrothecium foliicola]|nr:Cytochrome P450 monooxygenase sdnE [Paramyrothecium foliicola]